MNLTSFEAKCGAFVKRSVPLWGAGTSVSKDNTRKTNGYIITSWVFVRGFGRTNPYTRSLLDAQTIVSKELVYGLVCPSLISGFLHVKILAWTHVVRVLLHLCMCINDVLDEPDPQNYKKGCHIRRKIQP